MLVLSRNPNEVIVLSDRTTGEVIAQISNCGVQGNQVKLGIDAPASVIVDRYEVHLRKQQEADQNELLRSA